MVRVEMCHNETSCYARLAQFIGRFVCRIFGMIWRFIVNYPF